MLKKVDATILKGCTKFSHTLQRACGLTCYFIAKIGVGAVALSVMVDTLNYFHKFLSSLSHWVILNFIMLLILFHRSVVISKCEEHFWRGSKPLDLLPYLMEAASWRLLWLVWFIVDVAFFILSPPKRLFVLEAVHQVFFTLGTATFYYFIAVNPLPPGKSKVREWLEKLFMKQVPVSAS